MGTWILVAGVVVTVYSAAKYWIPRKHHKRTKKAVISSALVSVLLLVVGTAVTLDAVRAERLVHAPVNIYDIIGA